MADAVKPHQRSRVAPAGLLRRDEGRHIVADMAALVGKEADHHHRMSAQPV